MSMVESLRLRAAMGSDKSLAGEHKRASGLAIVLIMGQTFVEEVMIV